MKTSKFFLPALISVALSACTHHQQKMNTDEPSLPISSSQETKSLEAQSPLMPQPQISQRKVKEDIYTDSYDASPEVIRYGRYTLVTLSPEGGQKYLLEQSVNVNMIGKNKKYPFLTVEQGLRNTLKNTGYSLCGFSAPEVQSLFKLQLPHVHYKFGPTKLRDALQMLAGEAYELTVNDTTRQICFTPRSSIPEMNKPKNYIESKAGDYLQEHDSRNY